MGRSLTRLAWPFVVLVLTPTLAASTQQADAAPTLQELLRLIDAQQKLIEEQGRRLDALQQKIDDLGAHPLASRSIAPPTSPDPAPGVAAGAANQLKRADRDDSDQRGERPEKPRDVVSAGDFPGSFRIPGSDAAFKLGGMVRVNWVTTLDPLLVDDRFITADIPVDVANAPVGGRVDVMAIPSRFNLDLRTPTGVGYMRAFLEADFAGSGNTLRLRHAFGQWRRFLFGQTWSTFSDPEAVPDGIDFEGLNAVVHFRQPQIRWTWAAAEHLRVALALENADPEITGLTAANQRPDVISRIWWEPESGQHLQAAALFRQLQGFPSNAPANIVAATGWGVNVSGVWPSPVLRDRDRVLFQVNRGAGIGHYITDLNSAGGQDGVYDATTNAVLALPASAGYVSYEHWWSARLHSAFTGGSVYITNLDIESADAYHLTRRYSVNVIWSPIPRLDLVAEILSGIRINKNGHRARATQIQVGSTFRF
jgi:DcaP outer membrane protein